MWHFIKNNYTRYDIRSTYEIINSENVSSNENTEPVRSIELSYTQNKINNIWKKKHL